VVSSGSEDPEPSNTTVSGALPVTGLACTTATGGRFTYCAVKVTGVVPTMNGCDVPCTPSAHWTKVRPPCTGCTDTVCDPFTTVWMIIGDACVSPSSS
jgi:hypothetical protein